MSDPVSTVRPYGKTWIPRLSGDFEVNVGVPRHDWRHTPIMTSKRDPLYFILYLSRDPGCRTPPNHGPVPLSHCYSMNEVFVLKSPVIFRVVNLV